MSTPTPDPSLATRPARSPGRRLVVGVLLVLAAGFALRLLQNGYHWMAGHGSAENNYRALTAWCAFYLVVCAGGGLLVHRLPRDDERPE